MNFELLMNISTTCQIALFVAKTIKTYRGKMKSDPGSAGKPRKPVYMAKIYSTLVRSHLR